MSLTLRLQSRLRRSTPAGGGGGVVVASFETALSQGSEVNLHDLSHLSDGSAVYDSAINWGDGSPIDRLRCPYPLATDPPVKYMSHSYKTAGAHTITLTATDASGNTGVATMVVTTSLPLTQAEIPHGRLFSGRDQYPGVDARLLKYGQPLEYLDTTQPTEAIDNPSLVRTAADEAALTAACQALAATGGTVYYTGTTVDRWQLPDRPYDGNGVRYNTVIWIQSDASRRPAGYPAPYTRMTPAIGAQLPTFTCPNGSSAAIEVGAIVGGTQTDGQYVYNYRLTGFGITTGPTYTNARSGAALVSFGKLSRGIVFEQCYSYLPTEQTSQVGIRRDYSVAGGYHAFIDCWIWGNRDYQTDSQGIGGWSINGPIKIVNCFVSGCEPFMLGGAAPSDSTNPEMPWRPRDLELRMCHLWRDQARVPYNIRYYDGSSVLSAGKTLNLNVPVASWDAGTRTLALAAPVTLPDGSFALPNVAWRVDYVIYVRSGAGAGQGAIVNSFTDATHLVLSVTNGYRNITTPLDATSVIELRLKIRWITKNNGELKDGRRAIVSECVFENGSSGDDSQFDLNLYKSTVNSSVDYYPLVSDVTVVDCVYLNALGGVSLAAIPLVAGYGYHGLPATRFHLENLLFISGDATQIGGSSNAHNKPLQLGLDSVYIRGVTAIGFPYAILGWQTYVGGDVPENEHQSVRGFICQAPTTPASTVYWFQQLSHLNLATADLQGNAVFGVAAMPSGSPGTWYAEPTSDPINVFANPVKTDLWGAADYSLNAARTGLIAATPNRLDWPRLKARTAGVRADVSIIPYQWDN